MYSVCVCVVCGCLIYQYIVTDYGAHAEPHQASVFLCLSWVAIPTRCVFVRQTKTRCFLNGVQVTDCHFGHAVFVFVVLGCATLREVLAVCHPPTRNAVWHVMCAAGLRAIANLPILN
jgi:hypothetical protein